MFFFQGTDRRRQRGVIVEAAKLMITTLAVPLSIWDWRLCSGTRLPPRRSRLLLPYPLSLLHTCLPLAGCACSMS